MVCNTIFGCGKQRVKASKIIICCCTWIAKHNISLLFYIADCMKEIHVVKYNRRGDVVMQCHHHYNIYYIYIYCVWSLFYFRSEDCSSRFSRSLQESSLCFRWLRSSFSWHSAYLAGGLFRVSYWLIFCKWSNGIIPH